MRDPAGRFTTAPNGDPAPKEVHLMPYDDKQPEIGGAHANVTAAWILVFVLFAGIIAASYI